MLAKPVAQARQARKDDLADVIRDLRGELTQEEFAAKIGVSHPNVSQWETANIWISVESFVALCKFAQRHGRIEAGTRLLEIVGAEGVLCLLFR